MAQASTAEPGTAASFAVSVPCAPREEALAPGFGGLAKRVMCLVDHLLVLLAINCTSAGRMFYRVVFVKLQSRQPQ